MVGRLNLDGGSGVARGGEGARGRPAPGVTILERHHIMKWNHISLICGEDLFSVLIWTKNQPFSGEDLFLLFGIHIFLAENPLLWRQWPFFLFSLHLFLDRKGVTPRNSAPGATIPSDATGWGDSKSWWGGRSLSMGDASPASPLQFKYCL